MLERLVLGIEHIDWGRIQGAWPTKPHLFCVRTERLTAAEANALRRVHRLPERTYVVLAKTANLPTLVEVRAYERELVEACGGVDKPSIEGVDAYALADSRLALERYVEHKRRVEWAGELPQELELVVIADKGDTMTKFGVYIATDVVAPQSPANILLLAAYRGDEKRELLQVAAAAALAFLNSIIADGGAQLTLDGETKFVAIKTLLSVDFKMLSILVSRHKDLPSLA